MFKWFSCLIFIVDQNKEAMLIKQHFFINSIDWDTVDTFCHRNGNFCENIQIMRSYRSLFKCVRAFPIDVLPNRR